MKKTIPIITGSDYNIKFGGRIRQRREEIGMSQSELARKLGYTHKSSISTIESGRNSIAVNRLPDFAAALETTVPYLIGWMFDNPEEDPQQTQPAAGSEQVQPEEQPRPKQVQPEEDPQQTQPEEQPATLSPTEQLFLDLFRSASDFGKGMAIADLRNNQVTTQDAGIQTQETG